MTGSLLLVFFFWCRRVLLQLKESAEATCYDHFSFVIGDRNMGTNRQQRPRTVFCLPTTEKMAVILMHGHATTDAIAGFNHPFGIRLAACLLHDAPVKSVGEQGRCTLLLPLDAQLPHHIKLDHCLVQPFAP